MSPTGPRFSVVASVLTEDPRQAPTLARQMGFDGLLFDAFSPSLNIPDLSSTGRREFRHVLTSQDRQLVGLRVDLGTKGFSPGADVDRLLSQFEKVMQAARELGAPLICADAGPLPKPPRENKPKPVVTQDEAGLILIPTVAPALEPVPENPADVDPVLTAQVDGALAELGSLADRYNVTVAFRAELASFAALDRALTTARCMWFGVDLDPVAMLSDLWTSDEVFSRLGPLIRHVRGRDAIRGADHRTKPAPIGRGDTKWDQMFSNLEGAAYHGWITLDPVELVDRPGAARTGLGFLKLHF
jgi:sugar phosphate isomerase/epimerase